MADFLSATPSDSASTRPSAVRLPRVCTLSWLYDAQHHIQSLVSSQGPITSKPPSASPTATPSTFPTVTPSVSPIIATDAPNASPIPGKGGKTLKSDKKSKKSKSSKKTTKGDTEGRASKSKVAKSVKSAKDSKTAKAWHPNPNPVGNVTEGYFFERHL